MLKEKGCNGTYINENVPNLITFLYADDIDLGTDTPGRLQKMINVLSEFCSKWALKANL